MIRPLEEMKWNQYAERFHSAKECKHTIIHDRKLKARSEFLREFDVDFGNNSTRQHQ